MGQPLDINGVATDVKTLKWTTVGISIVSVVGIISLLITTTGLVLDSLADKKAASQATNDKILNQTNEIENLQKSVDALTEKVDELKQKESTPQ